MKVAELFISINGEGRKAGECAVFVRFAGCNLNCSYCDTTWANEKECPVDDLTPEQIEEEIIKSKINNITITGGEPMLQPELDTLLTRLYQHPNLQIEIETNGSVPLDTIRRGENLSFTMDYKLPTSGCETQMRMDNFQKLKPQDTVKFVAGSRADLERALEVIQTQQLIGRCAIYVSPVFGKIEPVEMAEFLVEHKLNGVRMQIQMHKVIWDPNERGV